MLAATIGVIATGSFGIDDFLMIAFVFGGAGTAFSLIEWLPFHWSAGAGEIVIEKGIFHRQHRVIPFDRVQDIAIEQRLLARLFGTAKVRIETGGAREDEGDLDMIALADAHALRDRIRRGGRTVEVEEAEEEPLLFAMGLGRLLLSGLFGFSLVFFAAIAAFVQQLDRFGLVDWSDWFTPQRADQAAHLVTLRIGFVLVGLVLALGMIAGVARTVARDFGFKLTRSEAGLRRRRGLFTLSEVVIPIRRTQVALIESGPVARLLGWYRLSFQTLGADPKEGGVQVAAPFARMEEILPILAIAGFPAPPPRAEFHGVPRRALLRKAAPTLALAALAALAAFTLDPRAGILALGLLALAILGVLRWRKHAHALGERALFVADGLLRRKLWIVPYEKTQTIQVSRGPVQRALRLASLLLDTAGAGALRSPEMHDLDQAEAGRMADRLYALFQGARRRIRGAA
ncbi:MAG TPA: PH domain-containing protein [Allosphingosinicella sp.]|nr:PH domain-containing protein [Allosphingosinicella sp.]